MLIAAATTPGVAQDTVVYFTIDAIGSVRMVTDQAGTVVARYDYRPFGDPCDSACGAQGAIERLQFAGLEKDANTGFNYAQTRHYANQTGRFTTVDPSHVGADVVDTQSWNGYAYARNNPLKYTDASGTDYDICIFGGGGYAGSCGSVSDLYFLQLVQNPGAGVKLSGGEILLGTQKVGRYTYTGPGLNDLIGLTGGLASRWLKENTIQMGIGVTVTAATMGTGFAAGAAWDAILAARGPVFDIGFKVGAAQLAKLAAAGISRQEARDAASALVDHFYEQLPAAGRAFQGYVEINGRLVGIKGAVDAAGRVIIGSIWVVR
jgi:RHS repeat-associated protein